jgi:hypothetical protein
VASRGGGVPLARFVYVVGRHWRGVGPVRGAGSGGGASCRGDFCARPRCAYIGYAPSHYTDARQGYSATPLLGYSPTPILPYSATLLLPYSLTRLLPYSNTGLLSYSHTGLLPYTLTWLLCYHRTRLLPFSVTLLLGYSHICLRDTPIQVIPIYAYGVSLLLV